MADPQTADQSDDLATATPLTRAAFAEFRAARLPRPPNPGVIRNEDERDRMSADELSTWRDGPQTESGMERDALGDEWMGKEHLWVVREDDVVHAHKTCEFGRSKTRGEITHTNLTGGDDAYVGGELVMLGEGAVVVNGDSGRYGTKDDKETEAVARAFAASGWTTYWVGFDYGIGRPAPIVGSPLKRVA